LEDVFIRADQPEATRDGWSKIEELQHGALNLLQRSISEAVRVYSPDYIIQLEGDRWILDETVIHAVVRRMIDNKELMLWTSAWDEDHLAFDYLKHRGLKSRLTLSAADLVRRFGSDWGLKCRDSLATQFFVARCLPEVIDCFENLNPIAGIDLEQALHRAFFARFMRKNLLRQSEREPVHPFNRYVCEKLALYSQHWPARGTANDDRPSTHPRYISPNAPGKKETLDKHLKVRNGSFLRKLLNAKDFTYYNPGASRV
jgi:hypothetical protein